MASSNAWAAVALVLISALSASVSAQSSGVGCFINGECYGGSIAGATTGVSSAEDCNSACKDQSTCKAWTHHAVNRDCVFYDSCPGLNPATCTDCVSGNRTCSQGEGCYFTGICQGIFLNAATANNFGACQTQCDNEANCLYFTFKDADNICLLYLNCPRTSPCDTCTSAPRSCDIDVPDKFMLVTGYDDTYLNDTEIVDLSAVNRTCRDPADFPYQASDVVAKKIDGVTWVCGGRTPDAYLNDCFAYNELLNTWDKAPGSLLIPREYSADVLLDANSWWVTGGTGFGGVLATTEIMRLGNFSRGPDLPWPMAEHCVTKVDETRYMFVGGSGDAGNKTSIYDEVTDTWEYLSDMPRARAGHVCQAIYNVVDGLEVVVAGGFIDNTADIYSFATGNWTSTEALPQNLYASSSTLLGKEMVVAGGFANYGTVTDIIRFDRDKGNKGGWRPFDQKLQKARNHAAMVSVSDRAADCS